MEIIHSLIIPVYKNEENIPFLLDALKELHQKISNFEVVFVVDGSPDCSYEMLLKELPQQLFSSQLILLSRNFGSFAAIRRGLESAKGKYFAVMAADLQEPPHLIEDFFQVLDKGECDIVLGVRRKRDDPFLTMLMSKVFWTCYRNFVIKGVPDGGVDVFACNKKVCEALLMLEETNSSLIGQLFWVGFKRDFAEYERQKRTHGTSAWNFRRKLRYMLDSVFAFSDLPINLLLGIGGVGLISSFLVSMIVFIAWFFSFIPISGYAPIILSIYFIGSLLILGQGLIGCYVWRCVENTKKRPITLIQEHVHYDNKNV